MRAVYMAASLVLLASLAGNWWQYKQHKALLADREAAVVETYQDTRRADDAAMQHVDKTKSDAAKAAQEKRDALKDADTADSIADLLERCRRGLFGKDKDADGSVDAAKSNHAAVPKPTDP